MFQLVQKEFAVLGISSNQATNPFNNRTIGCLFLFGLNIILYIVFLFHSAKSFMEYTENIYITSAITLIGIAFFWFVLKMKNLFELLDGVEMHINGKKQRMNLQKSISWKRIFKSFTSSKKTPIIFSHITCRRTSRIYRYHSIYRKIEWSFTCGHSENDTTMLGNAQNHLQLLSIYDHRFGKWCFRLTRPNVVKFVKFFWRQFFIV